MKNCYSKKKYHTNEYLLGILGIVVVFYNYCLKNKEKVRNVVNVSVTASLTGPITASLTGPITASLTGPITASLTGPVDVYYSNNQADAFGRLRVSETNTLLDISNTIGKNDIVLDESLNGGASSTFNANNSCVDLQVSNNGDEAIRQSRKYTVYQPGKSLLIQMTGVLNAGVGGNGAGTRSRIGYFDGNNGYFFEYFGGNMFLVERSNVTGSVTENRIQQLNWNLQTLLTGSYILNPSQAQIFIFDFQWLGVGRVRCGLVHNGIIQYMHEFLHDNITTTTYTTNMNLPLRYQITSESAGSDGIGTLREICGTVISEGGYNPIGLTFSAGRGNSPRLVNNGNEFPLLTIRLRNTYPFNRVNVIPGVVDILADSNQIAVYYIRLYRAPGAPPVSINGPPPVPIIWNVVNSANSAVEYNIDATNIDTTTYSNVLIFQGYLSGKTTKELSNDLTDAFTGLNQLTSSIAGNTDYLVISARRLDNSNFNMFASLQWREIF